LIVVDEIIGSRYVYAEERTPDITERLRLPSFTLKQKEINTP